MNIHTRNIAELLSISLEDAERVQYEMECNDFDFSEATDCQFKREALFCYSMIADVTV
jgi:hypothetical protein